MENLTKGSSVNPLEYPSVVCDKCGGELWDTAMVIKRIPGMLVGAGSDEVEYPINVLVCHKCGAIMKKDRELLENNKKEEKPSSTLIL